MKSGRPVKMVHEREEVFLTNRGRHPYVMDLETGVTAEGVITAFRFRCLLDGGAYGSFGIVTLYYSGQLLTLPYVVPAFEFSGERVCTNKPACGAQRGHGEWLRASLSRSTWTVSPKNWVLIRWKSGDVIECERVTSLSTICR